MPDHNEGLITEFNTLSGSKGWLSRNFACSDQHGLIFKNRANPAIEHQRADIYQMVDHNLFLLPSATIISYHAYRAVGGFYEQFNGYEDNDLFIRLLREEFSFEYVDKKTSVWRMHKALPSSSVKMLFNCQGLYRLIDGARLSEIALMEIS